MNNETLTGTTTASTSSALTKLLDNCVSKTRRGARWRLANTHGKKVYPNSSAHAFGDTDKSEYK